ncbi:hypothetical protein LDO26_16470 [Luteimonas sp. BDR2-5]|uniref:hypothetical protein n=1 Tax=Proluteimonas luteida TaxID=2878685 RepID=UPI001E46405A|nr:hypothetical protein [Luteimonas sp. BDR2-5]MCD9029788.1 hypothetical protein [Luteimonas sp. BDR2-5]
MAASSRMSRRWPRLRGLFARSQRSADSATLDVEAPLRAQLFSAEQMALHGKALALTHRVHPWRVPDRLLARLGEATP